MIKSDINPYYYWYLKAKSITLRESRGYLYQIWITKRHAEFNSHDGVMKSFQAGRDGYKEEFLVYLEDFAANK